MAVPQIKEFDPSGYTRSTGAALGQTIQQIGNISANAVTTINSPEYKKAAETKKTAKATVEQIMEVEREQFRLTNKMYGEEEEATLVNVESFGENTTEEFQRAGGRKVKQKPVNSKTFKKEEQHLSRIKKELTGLSNEQLQAYKAGRGNYLFKKTEFQKKYGKDAIQWMEPSAVEYIADPTGKDTADTKIQKYVGEGTNKYFQQKVNEYLNDPKVKAAKKAIQTGGAPPNTIDGTKEGFYQWLIGGFGAPDTERDVDGGKLPNDVERGRWEGNLMSNLGDTKNRLFVDSMFDDQSKRIDQNLTRQNISNRKEAAGDKATEKATDKAGKEQTAFEKSLTDTGNIITKQATTATDKLSKAQAARRKFGNDIILDPDFANASEKEIDAEIITRQVAVTDSEQNQQVVDALTTIGVKERVSQSTIRNLSKQVFDDKPDAPGSTVAQIRKELGLEDAASDERPGSLKEAGQGAPLNTVPGPVGSGGEPASQPPAQGPTTVTIAGENVEISARFETIGELKAAKTAGEINSGDIIWVREGGQTIRVK